MSRFGVFAILVALTGSCDAEGRGLADVTVIDRDTGVALSPHYYHGDYWVAGTPGARYAIEIHNRLDERLLAVTSVDGVNVVSGATAAWDQGGYVFGPGERYQISGWRKTDAEVAAFAFAASPSSYAERTGRPANVGVIGVAIFRERQPPPNPPAISGQSSSPREASRAADSTTLAPQAMASPKLGTGHGEREYSIVNRTEFERRQPQPDQVIRIRYDSLENLLAMGIVARPPPLPPRPNPFPDSRGLQYVPDPPG